MLCQMEAKGVEAYINEHPSVVGGFLTSGEHAYQLKRGRALLRINMNHPTRQMNPFQYVELDSSHLSSCIQQALKSENVSQLAKVLAEYESESRSAEVNSPGSDAKLMTSPVSRDACKLFLSSGSSVEAEVYHQLVVERINDGDITTSLKLCCIGHQIPFGQETVNSNQSISDDRTLGYTFDQMLKIESYEQEMSKFQSICEEWYRVLEPRELMNIEQRELLREWISTRQYANTEDPIVSRVIEKCSEPKKEEEERKWREAKKMREEIMKRIKEEKKAKKMREKEEKEREWQEAKRKRDKIMKKMNDEIEAERELQDAKKMGDD